MHIAPTWPEWVIRQGFACVWVKAPSAGAASDIAAECLGAMGGWETGSGVEQEIFAADEYPTHARPGDYTRSLVVSSRSS